MGEKGNCGDSTLWRDDEAQTQGSAQRRSGARRSSGDHACDDGDAGGQLFRELIDEEESAVEVDFCGIEGLTVEFATHRVGMAHAVHTDQTASSTSAST